MSAAILKLVVLGSVAVIFFWSRSRLGPLLVVVALGIEVAIARQVLTLEIKGLPIPLILGGVLVAGGLLTWLEEEHEKLVITAATVVMAIGGIQMLAAT